MIDTLSGTQPNIPSHPATESGLLSDGGAEALLRRSRGLIESIPATLPAPGNVTGFRSSASHVPSRQKSCPFYPQSTAFVQLLCQLRDKFIIEVVIHGHKSTGTLPALSRT